MNRRLHYIDWLRVIAVLLLFPFHAGRVFDVFEPFYAKSSHLSEFLSWAVVAWLSLWQMPLFFLVAGMSAYFALRKRSAGEFLSERVFRLVVPFVFGVLVLVPPQTWYGARTNAGYTGSFWTYLTSGTAFDPRHFFATGDYFGGFGIGQMWFVLFLFVLSAVALPIFLWARPGRGGERFALGAARRLAKPAWWWLPPFALLVSTALPDPGGKNPFFFLVLLVLGYLVVADEAFTEDAKRFWSAALATGFVLSVGVLASWAWRDTFPDVSLVGAAHEYTKQLAMWLILLGLIGLGARFLDWRSPALNYLCEAGYPLYILHQTVIVVVAFYLVQLGLGWPGQYSLVLIVAVPLTFVLYEGVRRAGWLRWLFGMKPRYRAERRLEAPDVLAEEPAGTQG